MPSQRKIALLLALVLAFFAAPAVLAQHTRAASDPFGKPLPSHGEQRSRLERLLGRTITDYTPVQRGPIGSAQEPFGGPDVPVAYTLSDSGVLASASPADLAETPDVKFTFEVRATVARLGGDPEKLYLYVKNGYQFTPYVGSQKGSQGTELEFAGNDFDQASFLIALLRAAGIPARYVFGSMFIRTDAALNWLGVDSPAAALRVLQWQGVPARFVHAGGGSLLVDRVWVQALIDRHGPKPRWVPMDPAFKQYQVTPASLLATSVPFDEPAYLHLPPTDRRTTYEFLASNLQNDLNATAPGTTVDDVVRKSSIIPTVFPKGLPGRLENRARHRGEASDLTDAQRYLVAVSTVDAQGLSAQSSFRLPEIYGQRLTVSFPPATAADQALVQASGGYYNAPADQLRVAAAIKLNGQTVATGSRSVSIGDGHFAVVDLLFPGATQPATLFHTVFAGGYYSLGLDAPGDTALEISRRKEAYLQAESTSPDPTYDDSTTGDFLNTTALVYLNHVQSERLQIGALFSAVQVMDVSEALTMKNIRIEFVNGTLHFRPIGWTIDAQRVAGRLFSDNGDDTNAPTLAQIEGLGSSVLESRLWDNFTGLQSISTTRGLQVANANGIPIYHIDQTNIASLLPTMNVFPDVLQNVRNEVNAGLVVTIPRDTIFMNQWTGSVWIEQSPDGLSAGYLIEGGLFGGSTTKDPKNRQNKNPSCSDVSAAFDAASGNFDSDFNRAAAYQESRLRQFDDSGDPYTNENKNSKGVDVSDDIGIMQINDKTFDGQVVTLPDGKQVTVDIAKLQNDPLYGIEVGSAILNDDLKRAQKILGNLGISDPSKDDLLLQAYYIYNHGSNYPPVFSNMNGTLMLNSLTGGAAQAQANARKVQYFFDPSLPNPFPNRFFPGTTTKDPNFTPDVGKTQPWLNPKNVFCTQ
jgi:Transglutaminase-like superfamily